jgi:hypothetical protein
MTMKIRITNESAGSSYKAKVRVFNRADPDDERGTEDLASGQTLDVGQSMELYVHAHRHVVVEEVQPGA